jgi:uncharacterized paraquat-inducible protein A
MALATCETCGVQLPDEAPTCPRCGAPQKAALEKQASASLKRSLVMLLFAATLMWVFYRLLFLAACGK